MMAIKLLAAAAAVLLALPAAAQNPASGERRTGAQAASTKSAEHTQKERRKPAKPCSAQSGKSAAAK